MNQSKSNRRDGIVLLVSLLSRATPDVFVLDRFVAAAGYSDFLAYLVESRDMDRVVAGDRNCVELLAKAKSLRPALSIAG